VDAAFRQFVFSEPAKLYTFGNNGLTWRAAALSLCCHSGTESHRVWTCPGQSRSFSVCGDKSARIEGQFKALALCLATTAKEPLRTRERVFHPRPTDLQKLKAYTEHP
jgi:hypothetical protein